VVKPLTIVSMFDGIACGLEAIKRIGIPVKKYYAFEIDKYPIAIAKHVHPEIIHCGDATTAVERDDIKDVDLLIAGSPCQGFSQAGTKLNFEDPRSKLFFEFVKALHHFKPKAFLLENVKMKKEWSDIITRYMGVDPVLINSSEFSAQKRKRLYWTNIPIKEWEDKGIMLKDVIFSDASEPVLHNIYGGFKEKRPRVSWGKSPTIRTSGGGGHIPSLIHTEKAIEFMNRKTYDGRTQWDYGWHSDVKKGKSATIKANIFKGVPHNVLVDNKCIRKFHPVECERLQTLPDNYTEYGIFDGEKKKVSNTRRYSAIGNGWTVDVVAHIFKGLEELINGKS